jgi:hypothetical protein
LQRLIAVKTLSGIEQEIRRAAQEKPDMVGASLQALNPYFAATLRFLRKE